MKEPRLLYSTNTTLAYRISRRYYDDLHYVWCTPDFGSPDSTSDLTDNPPTSQALHRYNSLKDEVQGGDLHGPYISLNKTGIMKGAEIKYSKGTIDLKQRDEIISVVNIAPINEFLPLVYVMVYDEVKGLLKSVEVTDRARPTSEEYIIEELPSYRFNIISW